MYNVTEYQYQQLKNYYPNCCVISEIGRQPQKEESPNTDTQQLKTEIAALESRLRFIGCVDVNDTEELCSIREEMRQLSAV